MSYGSGTQHRLLGRDADVHRIDEYVDSLTTAGSVLLLTGDPGVGKSVLLDVAQARAGDRVRVLRCAGVEFEVEVAYSGLHQALLTLRGEIRKLDAVPRSAVQVAIGLSVAAPQEPLIVSNAVLELLERAAAERPLLILVDDAQWLDRATAFTLAFVARRVAGARLGLLVAARTGADNVFQSLRVAQHELVPLDGPAAGQLLATHFPDLDPRVRARLVAEAQGNPLALLELPVSLGGPRRDALERLPAILPLTDRLQAVFAARLDGLDDRTREVVLLAALEGTGRLDVLQRAARTPAGLAGLGSAERAQLLSVDDDSRLVRFRHPLVRGAVVGASTHAERQQAHQALAEAFRDEPDRHVWHRAAAVLGPDADVAALLDAAGHRSLRRGDGIGAVTALMRSAELTPVAAEASSRLAEAAYIAATVSGAVDSIGPLVEGARHPDALPSTRLYSAVAAAFVLFDSSGEIETAHRMLATALDAHDGSWDADDGAVQNALISLLTISAFLGVPEAWEPFHAGMRRLKRAPSEVYLMAELLPDPARASAGTLALLDREVAGLDDETDPWRVVKICGAGMFVDRIVSGREALLRTALDDDDAQSITISAGAQQWLALHYYDVGQWRLAHEHIDRGMRLYASAGHGSLPWNLKGLQAALAAAEGDYEVLDALRDEGMRWAGPKRALGILHRIHSAVALGALGRGDYETAFQQASLISPPGVFAPHAPRALHAGMDLVEAAVHSGRYDAAAAHVAAMTETGIGAISARLAMLVAASEGLVQADPADAARAFRRALAQPGTDRWPFDRARVRLSFGERLRRDRATSESRTQLRAALAGFERLGARRWAERAGTELLATGQSRVGPEHGAAAGLTPQERQIAELAASGLTNKEIGARLYLSHRTVGSHLHHVFPKLGIASRAALRDALNRTTEGEDADR